MNTEINSGSQAESIRPDKVQMAGRTWARRVLLDNISGHPPDKTQLATYVALTSRGAPEASGGGNNWKLRDTRDPIPTDQLATFIQVFDSTPDAVQAPNWYGVQLDRLQALLQEGRIAYTPEAEHYLLKLSIKVTEYLAPLEDDEAIALVREEIRKKEEYGETQYKQFKWYAQPEIANIIARVKKPDLTQKLIDEANARENVHDVFEQYKKANGSEESLGKLITKIDAGYPIYVLETKSAINTPLSLSNLAKTTETLPSGEGVSLSWQISRAVNLYVNFLGKWAEADRLAMCPYILSKEDQDREKDARKKGSAAEDMEKRKLNRNLPWQLVEYLRHLDPRVADLERARFQVDPITTPERDQLIQEAQESLADLKTDLIKSEGVPTYLERDGIRAEDIKRFFDTLPANIKANQNQKEFQDKVKNAPDDQRFSLKELFGKNPLTEEMDNRERSWAQHVIAFLSGSTDAELITRRLIIETGEAAELNTVWAEGALDSGDIQKLLRLAFRVVREAGGDKPSGPDASLFHFPEKSGKGWMRRAKIDTLEQGTKPNGDKIETRTIFEELRRGIPFHRMLWDTLPDESYSTGFLLGLLRSLKAYSVCTTKDITLKLMDGDGPKSINKAFQNVWGDEFPRDVRKARPWESPWTWFAIGLISEINPEGRRLPGMKKGVPRTQRLVYEASAEARARNRLEVNYDDNFATPIQTSGLLLPEEFNFLEKYVGIAPKFFGIIRW